MSALPARHSFDLKYYGDGSAEATVAAMLASPSSQIMATPPKLQSSYSANDIATIKSTPGSTISSSTTNNHAQQYLHNHNASLGRIPAGAMHNRHSRELSTGDMTNAAAAAREYASIGTALQSNPTPYGSGSNQMPPNGPVLTQAPLTAGALAAAAAAASSVGTVTSMPPSTGNNNNHFMNGYYGGNNYSLSSAPPVTAGGPTPYGINNMPVLAQAMQGLALNGHGPMYPSHQPFNGYAPLYGGPAPGNQIPPRDNQTRIMQSRRQMENEGECYQ